MTEQKQTPRNGQTLKNVSLFIRFEAVDKMIGKAESELVDSLIEKISTYLEVSSIKVYTTSSGRIILGYFFYSVGKSSYELNARFNEDTSEWELV